MKYENFIFKNHYAVDNKCDVDTNYENNSDNKILMTIIMSIIIAITVIIILIIAILIIKIRKVIPVITIL